MPKKTFFNLPIERQNEIVEKGIDIYIEVPFAEITLRRLTEALEMPIGTFYRYFYDKDELFLYTCDLMDARFMSQNFPNEADLLVRPAYDVPGEDKTPPRYQRFFECAHRAPEELLRRFYFDTFAKRSVPFHKHALLRLKYQGLLREEVDLDLVAYIYATGMYNLNMYFKHMEIEDEELRWNIRKNMYFSFLKHGIMKREIDVAQERNTEEGADESI